MFATPLFTVDLVEPTVNISSSSPVPTLGNLLEQTYIPRNSDSPVRPSSPFLSNLILILILLLALSPGRRQRRVQRLPHERDLRERVDDPRRRVSRARARAPRHGRPRKGRGL